MVNLRQSDYKPFSWVQLELVPGLSLLGLLDEASAAPFSPLEGACVVLSPSPGNEELECDEYQKVCSHALLLGWPASRLNPQPKSLGEPARTQLLGLMHVRA